MAISSAFEKAIAENSPQLNGSESGGESPQKNLKPLRATRFSEIEAKLVKWLWPPFIALGTFNLFEGEEGIGKTFVSCAIACGVAAGKGLPLVPKEEHIEPSNVVLISAEDSLSYVLKPRLESMDAPCERIIGCEEPFALNPEGIVRLKMLLAEFEPKLIIIDPLFSYTGRINLDRDSEIRSVTDELKRLAETFECSILGIRHIGKSKGFGDARNAGLNGIGWRASARSVLLVGKNPENESQRAIIQTKNNLAPISEKAIGYKIADGKFHWTGESDLTAKTVLSSIRPETSEETSEKQDAMSFLQETLNKGRQPTKDIQADARQCGISDATLRRAKTALNIQSIKDASQNGKWFWQLPEDAPEDAQKKQGEHLQLNNTNKTSYTNNLTEDAQGVTSEHLRTCSNCNLEMKLVENGTLWFCPMGCGSIKVSQEKSEIPEEVKDENNFENDQ
ncbi:MAG: AAA family ATPase [Pyrinomonadaceae bacterium]